MITCKNIVTKILILRSHSCNCKHKDKSVSSKYQIDQIEQMKVIIILFIGIKCSVNIKQ
ncbi:hypothetical protein RchiOBHm_Chr1g0339071 [Rosa chinensis]|uniref:Uncharacterized protein n=1 Tax=Rosa chinensis TaxID=74649 RepID=A0A2P6SD51_ROSCH|nr:hypothetical protein RchiOBHm_Chr1g0339071 [Rosa chinensis]